MLPSAEAIEEEDIGENVTRAGMFKRNSHFDEEHLHEEKMLRKSEGDH